MRSTLSGWEVELAQWLKPFLDRLGRKAPRPWTVRQPTQAVIARLKHLPYLQLEPNRSCFGNHPDLES